MKASNAARHQAVATEASDTHLEGLHPVFAALVTRLLRRGREQGLELSVVAGRRSFAEQNARYALGRTEPGEMITWVRGGGCFHNYGLAAEIELGASAPASDWGRFGVLAQTLGLKWGGDFGEPRYVQLRGFTIAQLRQWYGEGGQAEVQAQLDRHLGHPVAVTGAQGAAITLSAGQVEARPGDTLGSIAQRHYGDWTQWRQLARMNKLSEDTRLEPGQVLRVELG